ncbi:MAG: TRAP transporter substrate-binding protein [Caldimonas sp.]
MKQWLKTVAPRALAAIALGIAAMSPALADKTIKVGLSLPNNAPGFDFVNGMYEQFKKDVESGTKGSVKVDLIYGSALGSPNDRLSQMRRGTIQMTDAADGNYATVYPEIQVLGLPYLFPTEQVAWKVLDGPFGQKLADEIRARTGIRVFSFWESGGFKHFSSNKPIRTPADFVGQKLRAIGPFAAKAAEALGASASPIAFNELYTSLKTGVVDGQDNSVSVFRLVKLNEVQKYLLLSGHTYGVGMLAINDAYYKGLSDSERAVVDAAARNATAYNRKASRAAETEALAFVKSAGVTVVVPDATTKAQFAKLMQKPTADWLKTQIGSPALIDEALAAVRKAETSP